MERVIPDAKVKKRIAELAVGLAADCDRPERSVEAIMRANLAGANMLPFVGFVTHDGKWVGGFSGYKNASAFLRTLARAEDTPHLKASPAVRKKLAALVATSEKAAAKGNWKSVVRSVHTAEKTSGRCPERNALAALMAKARTWAETQLAAAVKSARKGDDLKKVRGVLREVKSHLAGEPESKDAAKGILATVKLGKILEAESGGKPPPAGGRPQAARKYKGTRWASLFEEDLAPPSGG